MSDVVAAKGGSRKPARGLRERLIGGGAWALVGRGGTLALNFLLIGLVTRVLSPDDAGTYLLAQSVVMVAAIVGRLGLEHTVVFLVSSALGEGNPAGAETAVRRTALLGVASSVVVGAFLSLGGTAWIARTLFVSGGLARIGVLVGLWSTAFALQVLLSEALRGFHAIREAVTYGGVVSGLLAVLALGALYPTVHTVSLETVVSVVTLTTLISAVLAGIHLSVFTRRVGAEQAAPGEMDRYSYRAVLRNAGPVLVGNVMLFVLTQVHLWVVASRMPAADVAVYAAAARMVNLVTMTFVIANQVLPPIIGELAARGDKALLERTLRGTALVVGLPTAVVLVVFVFAGKLVMRLAFGPFYEHGDAVLSILSVGQVANVFTGSSVVTLLMTGHSVAAMWLSGLAGAAVTVACLAVVGGGIEHVAWAVSAVIVVQQLATLVVVKRLVGVWTHPSFAAAIGMARRAWDEKK